MKNFKLQNKIEIYEDLISLNEVNISFVKNAQDLGNIGTQLFFKIKSFWAEQSSGDIKADLFNLLARGGIKMLIPGPIGWALSLGATALGIDFWGIFKSVYERLAPDLKSGFNVGRDKIDSAVDGVLGSSKTASFNKTAAFDKSILSKIIKFIFHSLLAGAASTAAVGVAKNVSLFDMFKSNENKKDVQAPSYQPKQTKFKINPGYSDTIEPTPWVEDIINNEKSIEQLLISFAKQVYEGLNGYESKMISSPAFQTVKQSIVFGNHSSAGDNIVIIPKMYKSKKQLVDYFIDDLAT